VLKSAYLARSSRLLKSIVMAYRSGHVLKS